MLSPPLGDGVGSGSREDGKVKGRLRSGKECPGREEPMLLNFHLLVWSKPGHRLRTRGVDVGLGTWVWSCHRRKKTKA